MPTNPAEELYMLTCDGSRVKLQLDQPETKKTSVNSMIQDHFGCDPSLFPIVETCMRSYELPNLSLAIEKFLAEGGRLEKLIGVHGRIGRVELGELLPCGDSRSTSLYSQGSVQYSHVELPDNKTIACVAKGLYFLTHDEQRLVVFVSYDYREGLQLQVAASERKIADDFITKIKAHMLSVNIYKGQTLLAIDAGSDIWLKFHQLPAMTRESLILPEGTLERIERHTINFAKRTKSLLTAKRHLKRGVLLHGEPGTGKTLTAMYLAKAMKGRTTIVLAGSNMRVLSRACRFARELQPATVILEDIDLIAEERSRSSSKGLLFELLNEMDGMAEDADVLFLLTTNRPEDLESALAARPGRVDLAVKIPLPDANCRRRLFELYSDGLDVSFENLDSYIKRTSGASASFIKEVMRRAALFADDVDGKLLVEDQHVSMALDDLSLKDSGLTRTLLGFAASAPTF